MKKMNKKGFTIVELVIVIAVIAILAAVLIPTFSSVIEKSKKSAALQSARNAMQIVISETVTSEGNVGATEYGFLTDDGFWFTCTVGGSGTDTKLSEGEKLKAGNDGKYSVPTGYTAVDATNKLATNEDIKALKVTVCTKNAADAT